MNEQIRCQIRDEGPLCCSADKKVLNFQAEIIFSSKSTMDKTSLVLKPVRDAYNSITSCCQKVV